MAKINTKFVNYFLFGMLLLAFIAPMTHSVYEGLTEEEEEAEKQKAMLAANPDVDPDELK